MQMSLVLYVTIPLLKAGDERGTGRHLDQLLLVRECGVLRRRRGGELGIVHAGLVQIVTFDKNSILLKD